MDGLRRLLETRRRARGHREFRRTRTPRLLPPTPREVLAVRPRLALRRLHRRRLLALARFRLRQRRGVHLLPIMIRPCQVQPGPAQSPTAANRPYPVRGLGDTLVLDASMAAPSSASGETSIVLHPLEPHSNESPK